MNVKRAKLAFGASVLALAATMNNAHAAPDPAEAPVDGDSTTLLMGKKENTTEQGRASFTVNIGELSLIKQAALLASQKTAIIFTGTGTEENRVCPFFNLATRKYEIEQIDRDTYKITADINNEDVVKVQASGCMVTTRPDLHKIKYLPKQDRNSH